MFSRIGPVANTEFGPTDESGTAKMIYVENIMVTHKDVNLINKRVFGK